LASIFLLSGQGLLYVIYSYIIVNAILIPGIYAILIKDVGLGLPKFSTLSPHLKFGIPLIPAALSTTILTFGDRYVIGFMMNSAAVGVYSVAYNLGGLVLFLLSPITMALLAPLSKAYDKGMTKEVNTYLKYSLRYFLMFSIPAAIGLSVVAMPTIKSLTTSEFLMGAMGVTAIIAASNVFYGLYLIASRALFLMKKSTWLAILLFSFAALNIILNIILLPLLGLIGAALSTLVSFILLLLSTILVSRKHIPMSIDFLFLAKCILASLLMGAVVFFMSPRGWTYIALSAVVGAAVYFGALYLLRTFKKNEINFFKSFIKRKELELDDL
jgi:O-antigen/teichoic acid export membrane protein